MQLQKCDENQAQVNSHRSIILFKFLQRYLELTAWNCDWLATKNLFQLLLIFIFNSGVNDVNWFATKFVKNVSAGSFDEHLL